MNYPTLVLIRAHEVALIIDPVDLGADGARKGDGGEDGLALISRTVR